MSGIVDRPEDFGNRRGESHRPRPEIGGQPAALRADIRVERCSLIFAPKDRSAFMKRKTVSLCLIARNEEATIGMAIKSVLALVDEVLVADTGSADNTQIIAEGYGARVLEVPWEDDFAAARNRLLDEVGSDWVLILDADEFLQPIRPVDFQRLLNDPRAAAYRVGVVDGSGQPLGGFGNRIRLFRHSGALRFTYPVHESLDSALHEFCAETGLVVKDSDLVVINEGQNPDRQLRQRERNLKIMRQVREANTREPYFSYLLGSQGLSMLDDDVLPAAGLGSAMGHLRQAWAPGIQLPASDQTAIPWFPDLGAKVASGLIAQGQIDEARIVCAHLDRLWPDNLQVRLQAVAADLAFLSRGDASCRNAESAGLASGILEALDQIDAGPVPENPQGVDSRRRLLYPLRYRGELALLEGKVSEAVGLFEQALGLDPQYSFAWLGMAECSRFAGDRKRALKLYLRTVTASEMNHRGWLRGCGLMRELDFRDNAASWWSRLTREFPEHPAVLCRDRETEALPAHV